jgi:hypothetical protein
MKALILNWTSCLLLITNLISIAIPVHAQNPPAAHPSSPAGVNPTPEGSPTTPANSTAAASPTPAVSPAPAVFEPLAGPGHSVCLAAQTIEVANHEVRKIEIGPCAA